MTTPPADQPPQETDPEEQEPAFPLEIQDVVYPGKALGRLDNCVVFVRGALPGETVKVRTTRKHRTYMEAELVEIVNPSPARVVPECPLAAVCQGCTYQHTAYPEELRIKQGQLINLLERQARVTLHNADAPTPADPVLGYRNKIVLHATTPATGTVLGYYAEDNRTVIDIPACPLAAPAINDELARRRADETFMQSLRPEQSVTFRWTPQDGVHVWSGNRHAPREWLHEAANAEPLYAPARSFFQVNPAMAGKLATAVTEWLQPLTPRYAVDLYCGVGILALAAAQAGAEHVLGIDSDSTAIGAARRNAAERELSNVEFAAGDAEALIASALEPLDADSTVVILDPPRRGLDRTIRRALAAAKPRALLYVSCAPDTLARDTQSLSQAGYRLERARIFDMFPRTAHFETLALLLRS